MARHIAIVEDEATIRANYAEAMERQGFRVTGYDTRPRALAAFDQELPDLVVIDVGLGDEPEGGFDLCRELRARSASLPIIFLTARDSDLDTISGLRLGADDYLGKDVSIPHLTARISALFRRMEALQAPAEPESVLEYGSVTVETDRMRVLWNGAEIPLTVTEFWMVHSLVRRPGHVKSRDQLMEDAQVVVDSHTVTSHMKRVRRKFQAVAPEFDAIETVHGIGYRWQP
jgi:two-component system OmpR family response regulator